MKSDIKNNKNIIISSTFIYLQHLSRLIYFLSVTFSNNRLTICWLACSSLFLNVSYITVVLLFKFVRLPRIIVYVVLL